MTLINIIYMHSFLRYYCVGRRGVVPPTDCKPVGLLVTGWGSGSIPTSPLQKSRYRRFA